MSDLLQDVTRETIVRHEAGEALGAISDESVLPLLKQFAHDPSREVADTCQLAIERIQFYNR